jgi:hypothetical protein
MDVSLMTRMKELEEENRRLKRLCIEAQINAGIVVEALAKNREAISPTRGGQMGGRGKGLTCAETGGSLHSSYLRKHCPVEIGGRSTPMPHCG